MKNYMTCDERYGDFLADTVRYFRTIGFEIDRAPDSIIQYYHRLPMNQLIDLCQYTCRDRLNVYEALSYGDAGVFLACPGPSLAGMIIHELADKTQREIFYQHVFDQRARTFLAVTEPNCGSNIHLLTTALERKNNLFDQYQLSGEKWLVGHGATGSIGVTLARVSRGPLGVTAVLLTPDLLNQQAIERTSLPMVGLRGARLGHLIFNEAIVPHENILGHHRSAIERGMAALIKTFNQMRPCVGAMAVGVAQAILDYIYEQKNQFNRKESEKYDSLSMKVGAARQLLYEAAEYIDRNPYDSVPASLAKAKATAVVEEVSREAFLFFGSCSMVDHPWLEKWYRDAWGFEYMEGTTHIHKKNVFYAYGKKNGYLKMESVMLAQ